MVLPKLLKNHYISWSMDQNLKQNSKLKGKHILYQHQSYSSSINGFGNKNKEAYLNYLLGLRKGVLN